MQVRKLEVYYLDKNDLAPLFGRAYTNPDFVYVRNDLPRWVQMSILVHEVYHTWDDASNPLWREVKAVCAQFFMPLIGSFVAAALSLSPRRLRFYWYRITHGGNYESYRE